MIAVTPSFFEFRSSAAGVVSWFSLGVTFHFEGATDSIQAVVVGQVITQSRRAALQQGESQRLLAGIFLRVSAAVTIVKEDGSILMANPAFQRLLGYGAGELVGKSVSDLTPNEYAEAAKSARAKQLSDGTRYTRRLETIAKDGSRIPVVLTSVALSDADQRMRVVTLIPQVDTAPALQPEAPRPSLTQANVGDLRVISLAAFRKGFGVNWKRVASRAMLKAEQIIRPRLQPEEVLSRSDEQSFVIWFSSRDEDQNAAVLASAVLEIRMRFLTEFGEEAAAFVSAAMVAGSAIPPGPAQTPARSTPATQSTASRTERLMWAEN